MFLIFDGHSYRAVKNNLRNGNHGFNSARDD
jgi:hypothetical protein